MTRTIDSSNIKHEVIYDHFAERQDKGQFDKYNKDMLTFINRIWNANMGVVTAMSHSGIGADVTNGFIQFVCDDPMQFHKLVCSLTQLRDCIPRNEQPTVEIRSKSIPREMTVDGFDNYVTAMFRTPKFKNLAHANRWWTALANHPV